MARNGRGNRIWKLIFAWMSLPSQPEVRHAKSSRYYPGFQPGQLLKTGRLGGSQ